MSGRESQSQRIALMAVTAIALYLCWRMAEPFIQVMIWAAVLAMLFYPACRFLQARTRRPALSAALSVLLVLVTVIAPLTFVGVAVVHQATDLVYRSREFLQTVRDDPESQARWKAVLDAVKQNVDIDQMLSSDDLRQRVSSLGQRLLAGSASLLGGLFGVLTSMVLVVFTLYYLFRDGERIVKRLPDIIPLPRDESLAIMARTTEIVSASVYGVLVIAMIQGTLGGLAFWALGIPSALLWGVVMIIMSTVPMAGSALVWAPAAIYLVLTHHYAKAAILLVFGVGVIGTVDNVLRPRLVGSRTRMNELFIFFSVLGGLSAFGILGLLIGPVILGITIALLDVFRRGAQTSTAAARSTATPTPRPAR
jgi:predicted PurR-regulated permease PerM